MGRMLSVRFGRKVRSWVGVIPFLVGGAEKRAVEWKGRMEGRVGREFPFRTWWFIPERKAM